MNKIYSAAASLAVIAAVFTACSNDEAVELKQNPAIGFNPLVNRSTITRGLSVEGPTQVKSFDVWAYAKPGESGEDGERLYMGYASDGVQIRQGYAESDLGAFKGQNDVVWGYDKPGELTYWPATDMLQFVALSPAYDYDDATEITAANETDVNYTFDTYDFSSTGALGFTYTANNEAPSDTKVNTQLRDILAAANYQGWEINNVVTGASNGNVPLVFRHLLSKIELMGQINKLNKNIQVVISEIKIHNIIKKGTCKLTVTPGTSTAVQNNFADENPVVWTTIPHETGTDNANYVDYTITKPITLKYADDDIAAATIPDANSEAVSLLNADDNLFLIPQTITAWDHDNADAEARKISQADTDHKVYLEIKAKITQNGIYILGSATEDGTAYCPLTTPDNAWKPGNKYTYTLIFGIGEDENGDNIGRPITFSCSVTNWNGQTQNISTNGSWE